MKINPSDGVIRRIDDLGRIVLPKDMRKHLRIRENDPVSVQAHVDCDGRPYLILTANSPCFRREDGVRLVKDIAKFMPSTCLVAVIPEWEAPFVMNGSVEAKGNKITASDISRELPLKLFNDEFRHTTANQLLTVEDVELSGGKHCSFTGMILCTEADIHSVVGVFHSEPLTPTCQECLHCGLTVFLSSLKAIC